MGADCDHEYDGAGKVCARKLGGDPAPANANLRGDRFGLDPEIRQCVADRIYDLHESGMGFLKTGHR